MPFSIAVPKVSLMLISTAVFGVMPETLKISFCRAKAPVDQHRRGREVADDELVALLGDLRRGGDVDDQRDAASARRPGRWRWSGPSRRRRPACGAGRRSPSRPGCARRRAWSRCRSSRCRASPAPSCRRTRRWRCRRRAGRPGRSAPARPRSAGSADLEVGRRRLGRGEAQRQRRAEHGGAGGGAAEAAAGEACCWSRDPP